MRRDARRTPAAGRPPAPLALALLLALHCPAAAAATYFRTTLDRVTVVSSASQRACDRLALRFLAFERAVLQLMGEQADAELLPVAVYQIDDRDALRVMYSRSEIARMVGTNRVTYSKFLPGGDFHAAVMIEGLYGDQPLQSALMFYAQTLMLSGPMAQRPPWYQLGISHLTNGALIRDDGSVLLNRNVQFRPVDAERRPKARYDLVTVLGMGAREANAADMDAFLAIAREFAKFGLLTTAERRSRYHELSVLMQQGAPLADAVREAFGMELAQLVAEFDRGDWKREAQYRVVPAEPPPSAPPCARIDADTVETLLGVIASRATVERPEGT